MVEEAQGEEPHPLSSVNLAGPVRSKSGHSFLCMLGRLPGLATGSPDFKGGLLVAAACSRASLSGHWGGQGGEWLLSCGCGWAQLVAPQK